MHLVGVKALKEELLPCLGYRPLHKCPGRASGESQRGEPESGPGLHCHCSAEADQASYLSHLVTFVTVKPCWPTWAQKLHKKEDHTDELWEMGCLSRISLTFSKLKLLKKVKSMNQPVQSDHLHFICPMCQWFSAFPWPETLQPRRRQRPHPSISS